MRRPFPRTSGSPQATPIVETPAHYAPTLFWSLALLSEVVIGSVEPTMSCVSCETRCKNSQTSPHCYRLICKSAKFYVILAENCSDWKEIVDFRLNARLKNGWTKTGRIQRKMKTEKGTGSSRAREFHSHPLTEPCVKVAAHTALNTLCFVHMLLSSYPPLCLRVV